MVEQKFCIFSLLLKTDLKKVVGLRRRKTVDGTTNEEIFVAQEVKILCSIGARPAVHLIGSQIAASGETLNFIPQATSIFKGKLD